jgi:hypothetical protein
MRGFSIASFAVAASVFAGACSSSSSSGDSDDAGSDASVPYDARADTSVGMCSFVLTTGSDDAPTGACGAIGSTCTTTGPGICSAPSDPWTCDCTQTGWYCGNVYAGGGSCDAGNPADAASDLDASDVSDADAS